MSLLKSTERVKRKQIHVNLSEDIRNTIAQYCQGSTLKKSDEFIEKATEFVFGKDKAWQQYQAEQTLTEK